MNDRLVVQLRVLARTEIVRRFVVEAGVEAESLEDRDEPLSERQQENLRFWTAMLDDYAFSDVAVEVPRPTTASVAYVRLTDAASGGGGDRSFARFLIEPRLKSAAS